MTRVPCTRAALSTLMSRRATLSCCPPPLCGPAPVTTVPVTSTAAAETSSTRLMVTMRGLTIGRVSVAVVGLTGAPVQPDRVRQEHDRHEEVRHHEAGLEVELHRELTEHGLREHAGDEPEGEQGEVASARDAHEAAEHRHDHRDRHRSGEESVRVLDEPVLAGHRDAVQLPCRATEPDRAAEPGVGETHGAAGDDDDRQQDRGDERDAPVRLGAQVRDPHGPVSLIAIPRVIGPRSTPRGCGARSIRGGPTPA